MDIKKIIVFLLCWLCMLQAMASLRTEGRFLKDEMGRTVLLRGFNVAGDSKIPPFKPIYDPQLLAPLKAMGANVVRLLFTWEAFEPVRGDYDESYLDYYESMVKWAQDNEMYVIVDIHQDAFSRFSVSGCGEGFPSWAVPSDVALKIPDNGKKCKSWGMKMLIDFDMHKSWQHFYANTEGVRDRYLAMLLTLSARLKGYSTVIGYDLLNEPWGHEDREISPLYEDGTKRIRENDPDAIIFVSPHALLSSGLGNTKLNKPTFDNFVYSPHYYNPLVITFDLWLGWSEKRVIKKMDKQARLWQVPLFLGEFGAPDKTFRGRSYVRALYEALDEVGAGGAQWVYTPGWTKERKDGWNAEDLSVVDGQGKTRNTFAARAYPQKIAGTLSQFKGGSFVEKKGKFSLTWDNQAALGATEIFVPDINGATLHIDTTPGELSCEYQAYQNRLSCTHARDEEVTVTLRLK